MQSGHQQIVALALNEATKSWVLRYFARTQLKRLRDDHNERMATALKERTIAQELAALILSRRALSFVFDRFDRGSRMKFQPYLFFNRGIPYFNRG